MYKKNLIILLILSLVFQFYFYFTKVERVYAAEKIEDGNGDLINNVTENSNLLYQNLSSTNFSVATLPTVQENNLKIESSEIEDVQNQTYDTDSMKKEEPKNSVNNSTSFAAPLFWTGSILINNGDKYLNNSVVNLNLLGEYGATPADQMQFSNDNIIWSNYEAYNTSKLWELDSVTFGLKTVYVRFKQGNNESDVYFDTIGFVKVYDGNNIGNDQNYTNSTTTLSANWTPFPDMGNGIKRYEYAVGSSAGLSDIYPWTSNELSTSVVVDGLSLVNGSRYYFSVRVVNNLDETSNIISSDGILVDTTAPQVVSAKTAFPNIINLYFSESIDPLYFDLNKIIVDNGFYTILDGVINIYNKSTGYLWVSPVLPGNATPQITFLAGAVRDLTGNPNGETIPSIIAEDGIAPQTPLNFNVISGVGYIEMSWSPVGDAVAYEIWRASSSFVFYYEVPASTTSFRDCGVINGVTYYYQVRARDAAGNLSPLLPQDLSLSGMSYAVYAPKVITYPKSKYQPQIASAVVEREAIKEQEPTSTSPTEEKPGEVQGKEIPEEKVAKNWPLIIGTVLAGLVILFWIYYWYVSWRESKTKIRATRRKR